MNVIACDVCGITNIDNKKPFAVVERCKRYDYNNPESRKKSEGYAFVSITPVFETSIVISNTQDKKILCNECTMSIATQFVSSIFSTENMFKLIQ